MSEDVASQSASLNKDALDCHHQKNGAVSRNAFRQMISGRKKREELPICRAVIIPHMWKIHITCCLLASVRRSKLMMYIIPRMWKKLPWQ